MPLKIPGRGQCSDTARRLSAACRAATLQPQRLPIASRHDAGTHRRLYHQSGAMSLQQRAGSGSEDSGAAAAAGSISMQEMRRHLEGV